VSERERVSGTAGDDASQAVPTDADGGTDASGSSPATGPEPSTPSDSEFEPASSDTDPSSDADRSSDPVRPTDPDRKFSGGREQRRLGGEEPTESFDTLPSMHILGQLPRDLRRRRDRRRPRPGRPHAADERINYERLKAAFRGETTTQALAEPVELELTARGGRTVRRPRRGALPPGLSRQPGRRPHRRGDDGPRRRRRRCRPGTRSGRPLAFVSGEGAAAETVEAAADELLGDLACYPSITGNTSLTEGSIRELLAALDDCENPYACPHGRPVVIELDRGELEDRFERDYPGHPDDGSEFSNWQSSVCFVLGQSHQIRFETTRKPSAR